MPGWPNLRLNHLFSLTCQWWKIAGGFRDRHVATTAGGDSRRLAGCRRLGAGAIGPGLSGRMAGSCASGCNFWPGGTGCDPALRSPSATAACPRPAFEIRLICTSAPGMSARRGRKPNRLPGMAACAMSHRCSVTGGRSGAHSTVPARTSSAPAHGCHPPVPGLRVFQERPAQLAAGAARIDRYCSAFRQPPTTRAIRYPAGSSVWPCISRPGLGVDVDQRRDGRVAAQLVQAAGTVRPDAAGRDA